MDPQTQNQEQLEEILKIIWGNIPQSYINDLVETFENRLQMCFEVFGGSISHFLSASRKKKSKKLIYLTKAMFLIY